MVTSATVKSKALVAFGRNDIRGTYRDPLLVMIVFAPVIWTTGVVVLTPRFTEMLANRYDFDLVPYSPLVLTAFLLLTSIIIGGLASFLVLDEVDAGTLTALRVTPVPLSTFFAYRAATVMVVTTVYVVATMSFSGILAPGLQPALIPIGLLAGLSAVVTLLLIVVRANNKIQGLAAVRELGMRIAGLPCPPWFIHSSWNLAFGVLPPYWAAKAFWVASEHGTWWPFLLGGVLYNLAIAWPLFRRFVQEHLTENEVAQPQIWSCHRDRQRHHHRPLASELPKPDRIALAGADAEHHHIGARAHGGHIPAEARSDRQRPPHGLHVDGIGNGRGKACNYGGHRGDVRDIVDKTRKYG